MTHEASPSLPAAKCDACERVVVVEWTLDRDESLASLCIHCGDEVDVDRHLSLTEAVELGYVAPGYEEPHGERGCRDGKCGVRQPSP